MDKRATMEMEPLLTNSGEEEETTGGQCLICDRPQLKQQTLSLG